MYCLIVDDNLDHCVILRDYLWETFGCAVGVCDNFVDAHLLAIKGKPDLIICVDETAYTGRGWIFLHRLLNDPDYHGAKRPFCVVLAGENHTVDREKYRMLRNRESGFNEFHIKPIETLELSAIYERACLFNSEKVEALCLGY